MKFWEQFWVTVLALVVVAIITGLGTWAIRWLQGRLGRRPDFVLRRQSEKVWIIQRARRSIAYEVGWGNGTFIGPGPALSATATALGVDMKLGDRRNLNEFEPGEYWFTWFDRRGRVVSRTVSLAASVNEATVIGHGPERDGSYVTF